MQGPEELFDAAAQRAEALEAAAFDRQMRSILKHKDTGNGKDGTNTRKVRIHLSAKDDDDADVDVDTNDENVSAKVPTWAAPGTPKHLTMNSNYVPEGDVSQLISDDSTVNSLSETDSVASHSSSILSPKNIPDGDTRTEGT